MRIVLSCLTLLTMFLPPFSATAQNQNAELPTVHLQTVRFHDSRLVDILHDVAQRYRVVIGLVTHNGMGSGSKVSFSLENASLEDVLNTLVREDPRYVWRRNADGTILVSSQNAPASLVVLNVHTFEVRDVRRLDIVDALARLPEVDGWLRQQKCEMGEFVGGLLPKSSAISLHIVDKPVSGILSELTVKSGDYMWSVTQSYEDGRCYINVHP